MRDLGVHSLVDLLKAVFLIYNTLHLNSHPLVYKL